jgi:dihydroorotate dehydrogenase
VSEPLATARALGFSTVVTGVRMPFAAMNSADYPATVEDLRRLRRSRTGAVVLMTATVHPFVHPGFRELHNPGFDKLLPLVRELAADGERPVVASLAAASVDELGFLAKGFADAGAAVLEANLADSWTDATLDPFESEAKLREVARRVAAAGKPSWVRLPERVRMPYGLLVAALVEEGVRGVVAYNDFHGYEKLMLEATVPIDVVVGGGIASGYDVARALQKGAKAVQVSAAALREEGVGMFARLEREMRKAAEAGSSS